MSKSTDNIRKLACNRPKKQTSGGKKFVVKACSGGNEKQYASVMHL